MTATIQKWGSSLAVCLPQQLAEDAQLGEGKEVELVQTEEGVLLKAKTKVRYRLDDLLAGVTPENVHPETDWGSPRGKEAW
ncbi:MAG TPA: AbrB/MazE/SpoVT family DNA-binding domain-containing protein [Chthoniobacteraceae bacterium]|jgi:antitoxin MazE|nr:AbrB/MazE/SpoVT family DNA-binding domain-containing protein [Chthoniobacteraceae bacterium]